MPSYTKNSPIVDFGKENDKIFSDIMSKVIERQPVVEANGFESPVGRRLKATTTLHNRFVLSAPSFEMAPQPERINREFTRVQALSSKDKKLHGLITSSVSNALSVSLSSEGPESVHEIASANESLMDLRDAVLQKTPQQTRSLDVLVDSIQYQIEMLSRDSSAITRAQDLLLTYAETMLEYVSDEDNLLKLKK